MDVEAVKRSSCSVLEVAVGDSQTGVVQRAREAGVRLALTAQEASWGEAVEAASTCGALCLILKLAEQMESGLVEAILDATEKAGVRVLFEPSADVSLPATMTNPIRLCLHHEQRHQEAPAREWLDLVLDRTDMIRASSLSKWEPQIWSEAMRRWRRRSTPGSFFVFMCPQGDNVLWQAAQDAWKASAATARPLW